MGENFELASMFVPKTTTNILHDVSMINDFSMKSATLDFYVQLVENEMGKIDGFGSKFPYCTFLIHDAIERLKGESSIWKEKEMEEVINEKSKPMKKIDDALKNVGAERSYDFSGKKNWLSSAELWNTTHEHVNRDSKSVYQHGEGSCIEKQVQSVIFGSTGGAFRPFKKSAGIHIEEKKASTPVVPVQFGSLSRSSLVDDVESIDLNIQNDAPDLVIQQSHEVYHNQQQKKQRRCWSSELHRKFINALNEIGGDKLATPKMIKELMQVDGLTNDEVKSHLQKYRLHLKKQSSSSAAGGSSKLSSWRNEAKPGSSGSPFGPMKVGSSRSGESMYQEEIDMSGIPGWRVPILRANQNRESGLE